MCVTCGCSDNLTTTLSLHEAETPADEHVHADGTRHSHAQGKVHAQDHEHLHVHGHPHEHVHADGTRHVHTHDGDPEHSQQDGPVFGHEHGHQDQTQHAHGHTVAGLTAIARHPDDLAVPGRDAQTVHLEAEILGKNQRIAERNRGWLEGRSILALNLVSSPGAGKTTLLERSIQDLLPTMGIAVVEGDQETANDAERIRASGARAVQINTGTGCHLEAEMLQRALTLLDPARHSLLLIENVGNLVCPALFDLGERAKVVIFSVTEGEDKPLKYPHMFAAAEVMILSKTDLLPHVRFDVERAVANARQVNPQIQIFPLSAYSGDGLSAWYAWLKAEMASCAPENMHANQANKLQASRVFPSLS